MNKEDINVLLKLYFRGETSVGQEKELSEYFLSGNVSPELEKYVPLFLYLDAERGPEAVSCADEGKPASDRGKYRRIAVSVSAALAGIAAAIAIVLVNPFSVKDKTGFSDESVAAGFSASSAGQEISDLDAALAVADSGLAILGEMNDCLSGISESMDMIMN